MIEVLTQIVNNEQELLLVIQTHGNEVNDATILVDSQDNQYQVSRCLYTPQELVDKGIGAIGVFIDDLFNHPPVEKFLYVR